MRFFFYGTLLDYDVMALVIGRRLPPSAYLAASLPGHARRRAKGSSYPVAIRDPRSEVPGALSKLSVAAGNCPIAGVPGAHRTHRSYAERALIQQLSAPIISEPIISALRS